MSIKLKKSTVARLTGFRNVRNDTTIPTTGCMTANSTPTPVPTPTPTPTKPKPKLYFESGVN